MNLPNLLFFSSLPPSHSVRSIVSSDLWDFLTMIYGDAGAETSSLGLLSQGDTFSLVLCSIRGDDGAVVGH